MAREEERETLVQGGLREYYDAMVVLGEFRREVLKQCRETLEKRLPELGRAIGGILEPSNLKEFIKPDSPYTANAHEPPAGLRADDPWAWIAFELKIGHIDGLRQLLAGVSWTPKASATASFMAQDRTLRDKLLNRFKARDGFSLENWWSNAVVLWQVIPHDELSGVSHSFDRVLREWIRLWIEAGDLKSVIKDR